MGMGNLARMAQQMQAGIERVQAELATAQVEGSAGGGAVRVVVTGKQEVVSVSIVPEVATAGDVEILQDLIVAAMNDALREARDLAEQKLGAVTGGMRLPGLG
jgi:DNA-binding YbaB/EbfC family protein